MAKREQLGEEGQNDVTGNGNNNNNSNNNNNHNGKRSRGDGTSMILAAAGQPPLQQPRRPFMAFSGTRHTRVGADYQVTHLPSPSVMSTPSTGSNHKIGTTLQA